MEDGVWRTVGGRRIFIKEGQSLTDAMKNSGKFKTQKDKQTTSDKQLNFQTDIKKVSLTGVDKEYQATILEEFDKIYNEYPIDISETTLKTTSSRTASGIAGFGIEAEYDKKTGKVTEKRIDYIAINKIMYKNAEDTAYHYARQPKKISGEMGTLWHEYAHQIDYKYTFKNNKFIEKVINAREQAGTTKVGATENYEFFSAKQHLRRQGENDGSLSYALYERLFDTQKSKSAKYDERQFKTDIEASFGRYATTEKEELLAEGFAVVNAPKNKELNEFQKDFKSIFNELFDEKFRR